MSTTVAGAEVHRYLQAVRAHLTDLSPDDKDELLEDLEEHLLEVAAEEDGTLEERLGPPAAYAEELRVSAGLAAWSEGEAGLIDRLSHSQPIRRAAAALETPQARALRGFVEDVRPGWWVLRGYLGILILGVISARNNGLSLRESIPIPLAFGSYVWGVILVPIAIWVSVQLGRRAARDKRAWLVSLAATAVVLGAGFTVLGDLGSGAYAYADDGSTIEAPYLHHEDGTAIANICPYSTDGKLLTGVLLFDSRGRAITNTVDYGPVAVPTPINPTTPAIKNVYPRAVAIDEFEPGTFGPVTCPLSIAGQPNASMPDSPTPGTPGSP